MKKLLFILSIFSLILQSCGSSSYVTSNFSIQKRKYTKGWNVKELFQHKHNGDVAEFELNSKKQADNSSPAKNETIKTKQDQEIRTENLENEIRTTASYVEAPESIDHIDLRDPIDNPSLESSKISESEHINTTSDSRETSKTLEEKSEKIPDMLFRVFFIIGFSIAIITIILTLLNLASDAALAFLLILFLVDVTSLFIVLALLIKRTKKDNIYKEPGYLVVFTEILFGLISLTALILWIEYAF